MSELRERAEEAVKNAFWRCGYCEDQTHLCVEHGMIRDLCEENERLEQALRATMTISTCATPGSAGEDYIKRVNDEARAALGEKP